MLLITFYCYIFVSFVGQMSHFLRSRFKHDEPEPNSKMHDDFRRDFEQKCRREGRIYGNLAVFRNFTTLLPCTPVVNCFLTCFLWFFYKSTLDVILVPLYIFVISLVLSTYISSVKLVTSINFKSINHSIKLGSNFPLLPRLL